MIELLVLVLAAWRLASLLVDEDGPWRMFARLRARAGIETITTITPEDGLQTGHVAHNTFAEGLLCVWCVSLWTATLLVLAGRLPYVGAVVRVFTDIMAISAGAIIMQETLVRMRRGG